VTHATETLRAFVAVRLTADVRARLGEETARLRALHPGVAWVALENLHLTLKFLGRVQAPTLERLVRALETAVADHAPFPLDCVGLGAFPTTLRPRVIWAGVTDGAPQTARLAAAVEQALAPLGFTPEARPFSAHVTLGRLRAPQKTPALARALEDGRGRAFGRMQVTAIALVRSDLSPRGARYTEVATVPLGRGGSGAAGQGFREARDPPRVREGVADPRTPRRPGRSPPRVGRCRRYGTLTPSGALP
jgi:RNA 2',3'-cyclic 3'-phosphodiesterase